jgi:phage replication-related protein YjqB (UPF0714/DUF867 family)
MPSRNLTDPPQPTAHERGGDPHVEDVIAAGPALPVCLSEDPDSAALNRKAHALEHCAIDRESLRVLASAVGRQVLIRRSSERLALYTVADRIDVAGAAVHVGTAGLARLGSATGEPPSGALEATVETSFTGGDPYAPVRLTEELLGDAASGLAVLAPHGGLIEVGTDEQARVVYDVLALKAKPVRAWIARGFNPTIGAHRCWHITSSEISERSFPELGSLFNPTASRGSFAHAVAFHGQNDSEAIIIGGGLPQDRAHTARKLALRSRVQNALRAVMDHPPAVEVMPSGPLAGAEQRNIVNRVTAHGNGIQLEQPIAVRNDEQQRDAIARAVAAFYVDLV